jgi:hypothetical protein
MAIIMKSAPRGGAALLAAHITDMVRARALPKEMPTELQPEWLSHSEPHPVYVATLDDLAAGKLLAAAKQTGWRYLLVQHDAAVAEAEIGAGRAGARGAKAGKLLFLGLTHSPFTAATIEALKAAERMPKVAKADYELRLLKVPAVYLIALWLHGGDADLLIPMGDPPGGLKKNNAYSEAGIIRALRGDVERTRQFQQTYEESRRKRRGK